MLIGDEGSANYTVGETTVTCTDADVSRGVGSHFYVAQTVLTLTRTPAVPVV